MMTDPPSGAELRAALIAGGVLRPRERLETERRSVPERFRLDAKARTEATETIARYEPRIAARIVAGEQPADEWLRDRLARLAERRG